MAFNVEQKVKCCAWAIAFRNVTEAIKQFQVAYPGIEPPSNPTITKWKNLLLETESVVKKYSICRHFVSTKVRELKFSQNIFRTYFVNCVKFKKVRCMNGHVI